MSKALVLHSGGIDSSTCLAIARGDCDELICLSIEYGSKHNEREIRAAKEVATYYGAEHIHIIAPDIFRGAGSALMDKDVPNPNLTYDELREAEGPSLTYVPFRNSNLLSIATTIALVREADYVYFGAHADDAHNWAYPDCTPEFVGSMSNAIYIGSYFKVRLKAPIIDMTKTSVVSLANSLAVPLHLTYSCYEGGEIHCGVCPTCMARKAAFIEAGVVDPTKYKGEKVV